MEKKLKVGDLVYVTPGFPFNDWNGLSATILELNAGYGGKYVRVQPIIPMPSVNGKMNWALFHSEDIHRENRLWLKKHLKDILKLRSKLKEIAEFAGTLD